MREIRRMPSALDLDVLRQTLGPTLLAPYARAFGPVPWLTAGSLTWPAAEAGRVAEAWVAWAVSRGVHAVRVHDVKQIVRAVRVIDAILGAGA